MSRHGHTASARVVEDGMVVDVVYQGRERAVPELAEELVAEVGELTRILSAQEREILETHLIDYRAWHEFGVERHQHGRWVPGTGPGLRW
ncbi:hypothetical protein [Streptomyces sp. NPDC059949]|uniref:hypothetical protein n=1 Tax=Streptomyces sp. NPDC059949 TaxID=3347013 RepID=UPI003668644C